MLTSNSKRSRLTNPIPAGTKVGRLTVVGFAGTPGGRSYWNCRCDCGKEVVVRGDQLRSGNSRSCGCQSAEKAAARFGSHGMSRTPEHDVWCTIKARCGNPQTKGYENYGGRGVAVHPEWLDSFEAFLRDVGLRPSPRHTIDRIDNAKGYEPGNCRWATRKEQTRNRRVTVMVVLDGRSIPLAEAAERHGISARVVYHRMRRGWELLAALTAPVEKKTGRPRKRQD